MCQLDSVHDEPIERVQELVQVESLAQVGVQLLLFTLGLEFSLQKLKAVRSVALIGPCLLLLALHSNTTQCMGNMGTVSVITFLPNEPYVAMGCMVRTPHDTAFWYKPNLAATCSTLIWAHLSYGIINTFCSSPCRPVLLSLLTMSLTPASRCCCLTRRHAHTFRWHGGDLLVHSGGRPFG